MSLYLTSSMLVRQMFFLIRWPFMKLNLFPIENHIEKMT
jgi:hypothetical protein